MLSSLLRIVTQIFLLSKTREREMADRRHFGCLQGIKDYRCQGREFSIHSNEESEIPAVPPSFLTPLPLFRPFILIFYLPSILLWFPPFSLSAFNLRGLRGHVAFICRRFFAFFFFVSSQLIFQLSCINSPPFHLSPFLPPVADGQRHHLNRVSDGSKMVAAHLSRRRN